MLERILKEARKVVRKEVLKVVRKEVMKVVRKEVLKVLQKEEQVSVIIVHYKALEVEQKSSAGSAERLLVIINRLLGICMGQDRIEAGRTGKGNRK